MINALRTKPYYTPHRVLKAAGGVAADPTNLVALATANPRGHADCGGYKSVRGIVKLVGGTTPTVTLQPLELVRREGEADVLAPISAAGAALSNAGMFDVEVKGGLLFMRVDAVTGTPTEVVISLALAEPMVGSPGAGR